MIRCRNDTMITFRMTIPTPPAKKAAPTANTFAVTEAIPTISATPMHDTAIDRARPKSVSTRSATSDPSTLPAGLTASSTPYSGLDSPIADVCPTAYSTNTANTALVAKFDTPTIIANVRSTRFRHTNRSPSAISARMPALPEAGTLNDPRTSSSAPMATAHSPTGVANAVTAPPATSSPAAGGPMN